MGGGGKGGSSSAPATPAPQINHVPSDYTSWDQGKTWEEDPNKHFYYDGENYYIEPGEDINDQSTWKKDTAAGYHLSSADYNTWQDQQAQKRKQEEVYNQQLSYYQEAAENARQQTELARQQYEEEKRLRSEEQAKQAAEKKRRRDLLASGRRPNLLTSGQGAEDDYKVRKPKLGGGSKRV
jgi:hypothetical protein